MRLDEVAIVVIGFVVGFFLVLLLFEWMQSRASSKDPGEDIDSDHSVDQEDRE